MSNQTSLDPRVQEAIKAALENNWSRALELNQLLLKKYPDDVDTINRLARSLAETGEINAARKLYQKVLKLDPYNPIASKNLKRLLSLKNRQVKANHNFSAIKGDIFLEEPGKTITTVLEDTAMTSVLAVLDTADTVKLTPHRNSVIVVTEDGQRVGKIPEIFAKRIAADLRSGSKFEAFVKSVVISRSTKRNGSNVSIFIRETHRSPKVASSPFPVEASSFTPFVREEALSLLSNQAPLPTEGDDGIEEIEVSQLPSSAHREESLEDLAEKEAQENEELEEE